MSFSKKREREGERECQLLNLIRFDSSHEMVVERKTILRSIYSKPPAPSTTKKILTFKRIFVVQKKTLLRVGQRFYLSVGVAFWRNFF